MAHQIVRQPDGRFAVWSSGVDAMVIVDATEGELIDYYAARAADRAADDTREIIRALRRGGQPYPLPFIAGQAVEVEVAKARARQDVAV